MVAHIMNAKCKKTFIIAIQPGYGKDRIYYEGQIYEYYIERHEETGTFLYCLCGHPMLEKRFKEHFIDIQEIRDTKIDQILKVEV